MTTPVPQSTDSEQTYRTPGWLFDLLTGVFGYVLDLAADRHNAKCRAFYDEALDAFTQAWAADLVELGGSGFCNPPFEKPAPWLKKAIAEAAQLPSTAQPETGCPYAITVLLPHNVSASWFVEAGRYAETMIIVPRFSYEHPDPERAAAEWVAKQAAKGKVVDPKDWKPAAPQGSMLICFSRETVDNPTPPGAPLRIAHVHLTKPGSRVNAAPSFAPTTNAEEQSASEQA